MGSRCWEYYGKQKLKSNMEGNFSFMYSVVTCMQYCNYFPMFNNDIITANKLLIEKKDSQCPSLIANSVWLPCQWDIALTDLPDSWRAVEGSPLSYPFQHSSHSEAPGWQSGPWRRRVWPPSNDNLVRTCNESNCNSVVSNTWIISWVLFYKLNQVCLWCLRV